MAKLVLSKVYNSPIYTSILGLHTPCAVIIFAMDFFLLFEYFSTYCASPWKARKKEEAEIWIKTQQSSFLLSSLSLSLWMVLSVGLFQ